MPLKILVGICGIGNGHVKRQINVIKQLKLQEHKIVIAVPKNKRNFLDLEFPDIEKIDINIPWISCNEYGVNYTVCLEKYDENKIDQFRSFLEFAESVEKIFGSKPDYVISDYEPNVAQYSYVANIPLICMEQQSKFLYLKPLTIRNLSINEEIYRLNYFFPRVNYRIISSFFPIETKDPNVFVLPPIIDMVNLKKKDRMKATVYFSPYCNDKKIFINILEMIKNITNIKFYIYTNLDFGEYYNNSNLIFNNFSNNFKKDLSESYFLISSSGHQLISESIFNEIPMYLFALDTYEQNYNCAMVEKYKLGKKIQKYSSDEFYEFYENIPFFISNIKKHKQDFMSMPWTTKFNQIVNVIMNKEKE